ncbi:hypothetical protein EHS25_006443 [Saitozyma podzolica]|jgi:hypothetical protein|uniref:Uncharacterized protein n=1 Tax=Saitozyma podzolica TaxID=1890683 RepID=A0A427YRW0_9TREE|nr:hypothetical protein EHS25_006443 [Saitozyma podzolica]
MEFVITLGAFTVLSAVRQLDDTEFYLTGRGTKDGISIESDADDNDFAIVTFPRGVSTWMEAEPPAQTQNPGPSETHHHDDHAAAEREHAVASGDRSTQIVGLLPSLGTHERTVGDKSTATIVGTVLGKAWFTTPTYRINLETELLRGLRNGVSDEELSLVRGAVSVETEPQPKNQEAMKAALARMQARFDAYPNPTVENFDILDSNQRLKYNSPTSSTPSEPPIEDRSHFGAFRFRWDDLVKISFQDSPDDSSAGDPQSPSGAGDLAEQLEDLAVVNEEDDDLLEL